VHLNQFFCVPQARYLGVTPQDILDFELEDATHPLKDVDIKRAKDALKNDPFFQAHKEWQKAIEQMLKMGVRAEQQALAKWGLNFVIDEYLPRKLAPTPRPASTATSCNRPSTLGKRPAHHNVAKCVDCHLPHALGCPNTWPRPTTAYRHSKGFTFQDFHEPIRVTPRNDAIPPGQLPPLPRRPRARHKPDRTGGGGLALRPLPPQRGPRRQDRDGPNLQ
jgi:hypothetical protein